MTSSEQDIRFLKEAAEQLQEYLLSNELYWPLSGSLPRLTPGALLLVLARVGIMVPSEGQKFGAQVETIRVKWRVAWEKKVAREITNRTRLWSQFLSDYINAPDQNQESYRSEARGRTILQLLLADLSEWGDSEIAALAELDGVLKSRLIPCDFLWEHELQTAFPKSDYWFLYGNL
ncbi:MAG: hypothetical protein NTW32_10510 [Chloroflexi bacterium]|nr:hypothetical protein [Chloroflexota bacterium]